MTDVSVYTTDMRHTVTDCVHVTNTRENMQSTPELTVACILGIAAASYMSSVSAAVRDVLCVVDLVF